MKYLLAYRNESTSFEWSDMQRRYMSMDDAISAAANYANHEMARSEMAIFTITNGTYWKDKKPRMIVNRQGDMRPIPSSIGALFDNYKPGNNPR